MSSGCVRLSAAPSAPPSSAALRLAPPFDGWIGKLGLLRVSGFQRLGVAFFCSSHSLVCFPSPYICIATPSHEHHLTPSYCAFRSTSKNNALFHASPRILSTVHITQPSSHPPVSSSARSFVCHIPNLVPTVGSTHPTSGPSGALSFGLHLPNLAPRKTSTHRLGEYSVAHTSKNLHSL